MPLTTNLDGGMFVGTPWIILCFFNMFLKLPSLVNSPTISIQHASSISMEDEEETPTCATAYPFPLVQTKVHRKLDFF
ncbi:hypothetical protein TNCV_1764661 [Trichonephila clavipes]|nr:hypothetical protein TNCV_1764661 [Trichonephila clavipes]